MLVSEVINAKAIALSATEDASNQIPYLGKNWFAPKKKAGLDLKWIKTSSGLPVALAPSNFDALPTLRARDGIDIQKTQMAFFREQMIVSEADAQEIARVTEENDPYLASAVQSLYNDSNTLLKGAEVIGEAMIMQLLATTNGHPVIGISANGVNYAYDYDPNGTYAASHYAKITDSTKTWDVSATAVPITDLNNARKALAKKGKIAKYALMNSNTFQYLVDSAQVKSAILAQNSTANIFMSDAIVSEAIKAATGLTVVVYDKMYTDQAGVDTYFFPDNKVTLLPEGALGNLWFGTTPEERSASQMAGADVAIYNTGIAISTVTSPVAPIVTTITASEIVLPSYENMDSTYVLEVK